MGFCGPILAQEIPVNIKADKLKFIEGTSLVTASGSVEVSLKGVIIQADKLLMDSASNIATAEGNVKLITKDYQAESSYIVYDADGEITSFADFKTKLRPKTLKGPLFLSAKELNDRGKEMLGEQGELTTCEDEIPHFFLLADRVEYYPDDKVLAFNVIIYVGNMPAFWLPFIYYDLSKKGQRNWVYGHNEVEGDYLKTTWGYPLGILYLDQMEKKGFGQGTELAYGLLGLGAGTLFLYHLDEKDTGITDWVTRINHTKQINPWTTLNLNHKYTATYLIPAGRNDQTDFGLSLGYNNKARWNLGLNMFEDRLAFLQRNSFGFSQSYEQIATTYNFNYDQSKRDPKWIRASQRLTYRRPLSDRTTLSTRMNYYNNVAAGGQPGDERLEPVVDISGRENGYSWRLTENWYIDLDGDTYTGDESYQFMEKLPELEVTPNPIDLKLFTLRPKFGYGHYHEVRYVPALGRNRDFAAQRYQSTLSLDRSVSLALGTVATLGLGLDQFLYSPGDERYSYRESLALRTSLGGFFSNNINFQKGSSDGNTPFLFDQLGTNYHNVRDQMTFSRGSQLVWTIDGGHNWQTHQWFDVMTNLTVRPDQRLAWNIRTGWSIEERKSRDLVNSLTLSPYSFLSTQFSTVSDMNVGLLKSGSILYDVFFLEGQANQLHLKFSQVYEVATEQFKLRDIMVIKDLHCWELRYTYSEYRKEFSMTISLKALPGEPVGMSTGRGFYFEGLERELGEIKPEGAIRRY
ncbi:MAG: hypothetical protein KJ732_04480 [Candidatus Margulisbacteria bacterium]|nr:hypothetical protein [Candidatus Margulisiibacteriota bacterium]